MIRLALFVSIIGLLSSCKSISDPYRKVVFEQCSPQIIMGFDVSGAPQVDLLQSSCECRQYKYSISFLGALSGTEESHPLEYCDKLIGESPAVYVKKTTWLQTLKRDLANARGK